MALLKCILGQKRNAAYKTYIVYGGSFTNLSQTICHSLSADSWIIRYWGCPSYHCHLHLFKPTFLSILTSLHLRNEFNFWKVHGIMNTSGLVQSK